MKNTTDSPERFTASDLFASGFDLGALRRRIKSGIAKAKFKALPKDERDNRASAAMKTIKQLIQ